MEASKYSNSVSVSMNEAEVKIIFNSVEPVVNPNGESGETQVFEVGRFTLRPEVAKDLARILNEGLEQVSKKNG